MNPVLVALGMAAARKFQLRENVEEVLGLDCKQVLQFGRLEKMEIQYRGVGLEVVDAETVEPFVYVDLGPGGQQVITDNLHYADVPGPVCVCEADFMVMVEADDGDGDEVMENGPIGHSFL